MKAPFQLPAVAVLVLGALVGGLRSADLPSASPFLPANAPAAAAAPALDTGGIELRGVMQTPVGPVFSIYNTARRQSTLVGLNETGTWGSGGNGTFVVRSYRQVGDQDQVTVDFQGRTATLVTKKARVGIITRGGSPAATGPAALTQTVSLNPTPESEALRLQAVTDEIARRRDARAQGDAAAATAVAPAAPARGAP
jgi:hypothetical protein